MAFDPRAVAILRRCDADLARVIRRVGPCTLRRQRPYFAALCDAIIAQQVSTSAAVAIIRRFRGLFDRKRPTPDAVLALSDDAFRGAGLSRQKMTYLRDLAVKTLARTVPAGRWARLDDDAVIAALTQVKGIGVWTAQMFLIFSLNRPDVLPVDDLGVRRGAQLLRGLKTPPTADQLVAIAEPWRPYRSVAAWYLWAGQDGANPGWRPVRAVGR